jgi:hypothetical protein
VRKLNKKLAAMLGED